MVRHFVRLFATQNRNGVSAARRTFSQLHSPPQPPSFGIAFDIDGVILLGDVPIGGSPLALKRLYSDDSGSLRIPFTFLTNEEIPSLHQSRKTEAYLPS